MDLHLSFFYVVDECAALFFWEDFSPPFEDLCAISGSCWPERCAYTMCKINVSSSVSALVSLASWCSLSLCTSRACCSFSSFLAVPGADKGRIRCLISLCSLRHPWLLLGTGGRAAREESSPCLSVKFSALRAAWAQADSKGRPKFSRHIFVPDACSKRKLKTQSVLPNLK